MTVADDPLLAQLTELRASLAKRKGAPLNEENTKQGFIAPVIRALGWNTADAEQVHCEYRHKSKDLPVDYALMIDGLPYLLIEAKALGHDVADRRWTTQVLAYSTQAGAPWAALTNGDDWHFYNCAAARVALEEKLFRRISIATSPPAELVDTLLLISKAALGGNRIDRAWDAHHTERLMREGLARLFDRQSPSPSVAKWLVAGSKGRLKPKQVIAALRRATVGVEFPAGTPEDRAASPRRMRRGVAAAANSEVPAAAASPGKRASAGSTARPSLVELIRSGALRAPVQVVGRGRQRHLTATIESDATVTFDGRRFDSLSSAGAAARAPFAKGKAAGKGGPSTNGWDFWRVADPASGNLATMDVFARRHR